MTRHLPSSPVETFRRSNSEEVRGVCLDVDDTLVDYEHTTRAALRAVLGMDGSWGLWKELADQFVQRVIAGEIDRDGMPVRRAETFLAAHGFRPGEVDAARWESDRVAEMDRRWTLFDDAQPCLDWLTAAGLRIAAVTNASGAHQREKLGTLGLAGYFDCVLIAGEIGAVKPDPVMFHTACVRLGLPPCEVVHVGDRLDIDALGARNAGLHGVWLNRDGAGDEATGEDDAAVPRINTLGELPELLVGQLALAVDASQPARPDFGGRGGVGYDPLRRFSQPASVDQC